MSPSRVRAAAALGAILLGVLAGCSRPDPDPTIRVTGDPTAAVPPTTEATTTTTSTTTTTLFYGDQQADAGDETAAPSGGVNTTVPGGTADS